MIKSGATKKNRAGLGTRTSPDFYSYLRLSPFAIPFSLITSLAVSCDNCGNLVSCLRIQKASKINSAPS